MSEDISPRLTRRSVKSATRTARARSPPSSSPTRPSAKSGTPDARSTSRSRGRSASKSKVKSRSRSTSTARVNTKKKPLSTKSASKTPTSPLVSPPRLLDEKQSALPKNEQEEEQDIYTLPTTTPSTSPIASSPTPTKTSTPPLPHLNPALSSDPSASLAAWVKDPRPVTPGRMRSYEECPPYTQDNPYILQGYRVNFSWGGAFKSLFKLHNETFNVWTHVFGFLFMAVLLVSLLTSLPQTRDFAYTHIRGASTVDRGVGFVAELLGIRWHDPDSHVFSYHEAMPKFCERYYTRYQTFMAQRQLPVDGYMPRNQYMDGELVIGPWDFPAQCKPLRRKIFSPSLAAQARQYLMSLPEATKKELHQLKKQARALFQSVPLPATSKNTATDTIAAPVIPGVNGTPNISGAAVAPTSGTGIGQSVANVAEKVSDSVNDAVDWVANGWEDYTRAWAQKTQAVLHELNNEMVHTKEAATKLYTLLRELVSPIAKSQDVDERALKHPAFLFKYVDLGEEYEEDLPRWPIVMYMISAMICLGLSAVFHLFSAVSYDTFMLLSRMDYSGISILIGGSNIPIIYYSFYCYPYLRTFYIALMVIFCLITFYVTVHPNYCGPHFRVIRTVLFIGLGFIGMIPFVHKCIMGEFDPKICFYLGLMGALYVGGAVIYVTQVPERCFPGRFDIFCSSHQWWHMFVFAATMVHYMGVQYLYNSRIINTCIANHW